MTFVKPHVISHNQALRLRAKQDLVDHKGKYVAIQYIALSMSEALHRVLYL